jgi:hypothetical protein
MILGRTGPDIDLVGLQADEARNGKMASSIPGGLRESPAQEGKHEGEYGLPQPPD